MAEQQPQQEQENRRERFRKCLSRFKASILRRNHEPAFVNCSLSTSSAVSHQTVPAATTTTTAVGVAVPPRASAPLLIRSHSSVPLTNPPIAALTPSSVDNNNIAKAVEVAVDTPEADEDIEYKPLKLRETTSHNTSSSASNNSNNSNNSSNSSSNNSNNNSNNSNNLLQHHQSAPLSMDNDSATITPAASSPISHSTNSTDNNDSFVEITYNYDAEVAAFVLEQEAEENDAQAGNMHELINTLALDVTIATATAEGLTGHLNEDRIVVSHTDAFTLLAVLDGHGGSWTAETVKDRLVDDITRCFSHETGFLEADLIQMIDAIDADIQAQAQRTLDYSGACLICVLLYTDPLTKLPQTLTLNVGDCRAIVHETRSTKKKANRGFGPNGRVYALSMDHCESNPSEKARVLASGAYIEYGRIGGVLEPFRSIGDIDMKERDMDGWVIATPEVRKTVLLVKRSTFVLATDGVWGSLTNQKVMQLVREHAKDLQKGADAVVAAARDAGSHDDIAVVVATV